MLIPIVVYKADVIAGMDGYFSLVKEQIAFDHINSICLRGRWKNE